LTNNWGVALVCGGGEFFSRRRRLKAKSQGFSTAVPFLGRQKRNVKT
jgi:hypothetical protein